ncbi:hypothetical protein BR93DRAFT_923352 [Coniochaeta sp. PMI_546]|nr:hypothetical protein BR93DRAFT_923352 [Coniochaeta sp. PMI_546]
MALGLTLMRLCLVRGIRYHRGFGEELRGVLPEFTRALNARSIMSGVIPEMSRPDEFPYCIWHPETASEDTYRQLVQRYPSMAYQVARACTVAGYTALYKELDILPEIHVAEEARECGNMEIYNAIMACPAKYNVMDDYTRTVNIAGAKPGFLNGDTAVCWSLNLKQRFETPVDIDGDDDPDDEDESGELGWFGSPGYQTNAFNITEDMNIDEHSEYERTSPNRAQDADDTFVSGRLRYDVGSLLIEPLPLDLPTVEKDMLILMAAYHGNIDRYARLRRPVLLETPTQSETSCVVRGCYHNTMFALWCSRQRDLAQDGRVAAAINARYIMNDILAPLEAPETIHLPYLIWYPKLARAETYRELARLQPKMAPQILRACIQGGEGEPAMGPRHTEVFDEVLAAWPEVPDEAIMWDAGRAAEEGGRHFKDALEQRIRDLGATGARPLGIHERWKVGYLRSSEGATERHVRAGLCFPRIEDISTGCWETLKYNGRHCEAGEVEFLTSLPDKWKLPVDYESDRELFDYKHWPPRDS